MSLQKDIKEKILRELEALTPQEQQTLLGIVENYLLIKPMKLSGTNYQLNGK